MEVVVVAATWAGKILCEHSNWWYGFLKSLEAQNQIIEFTSYSIQLYSVHVYHHQRCILHVAWQGTCTMLHALLPVLWLNCFWEWHQWEHKKVTAKNITSSWKLDDEKVKRIFGSLQIHSTRDKWKCISRLFHPHYCQLAVGKGRYFLLLVVNIPLKNL